MLYLCLLPYLCAAYELMERDTVKEKVAKFKVETETTGLEESTMKHPEKSNQHPLYIRNK